MEEDPFAIVEAMAIAAFATGCAKGFIYIRGEYPLAAARLQHAIDASRQRRRPRATSTSRFAAAPAPTSAAKRRRSSSRSKGAAASRATSRRFPSTPACSASPPSSTTSRRSPTCRTSCSKGATAFATVGTAQSTGTRLFCLSGASGSPGVYEAPFGITLRALIEMAGGLEPGRTLRTVLLGGAAGSFVRPDEIDLRLTHEDTRAAGTTLGSGVVMVVDDTIDPRDLVLRIAAFFRDESCGQCVPCRVGTVRQEEALHRIVRAADARRPRRWSSRLLDEVGAAMRDASICGLGQTAYAAIESAIKRLQLYDDAGPRDERSRSRSIPIGRPPAGRAAGGGAHHRRSRRQRARRARRSCRPARRSD